MSEILEAPVYKTLLQEFISDIAETLSVGSKITAPQFKVNESIEFICAE
jgi:hypothetical protein